MGDRHAGHQRQSVWSLERDEARRFRRRKRRLSQCAEHLSVGSSRSIPSIRIPTPKKRTALGRLAHEGAYARPGARPANRSYGTWAMTRATSTSTSTSRTRSGIRAMHKVDLPSATSISTTAAVCCAVPAGWLGPMDRAEVRNQRHHAEQRRVLVRRSGGCSDQCSTRRRRRGSNQDGSSRVGRRQSEKWRGLFHADQQRRPQSTDHRCRRRQPALLQRSSGPQARTRRAIRTAISSALRRMAASPTRLSFTWDVFLFGAARPRIRRTSTFRA